MPATGVGVVLTRPSPAARRCTVAPGSKLDAGCVRAASAYVVMRATV
ncbi:MAG: hypothetical protein M3389_07990 [Actinomycetota bacterium]|nr:hypothetical protein [Actinomycetota bacterium]